MTSLSIGLLINDLLGNDQGVKAITENIFPVVAENGAKLPYICYRRASIETTLAKNVHGADACVIEVMCYDSDYDGSIALAEAVRAAMDNAQATYTASSQTLVARGISLMDSEEAWADDAYAQALTFMVRIN